MIKFSDFLAEAKKATPVPVADYIPSHGSHAKPKKKKKKLKEEHYTGKDPQAFADHNPNPHLGKDYEEVHNALNQHKDEWNKTTHPHEKYAVHNYTEHSGMVNNNLINKAHGRPMSFDPHPHDEEWDKSEKAEDKQMFHDQVHGLDSLLKRSKAPHDLTVFHGISADASAKFHPGNEAAKHPERHLRFPSYLSTSVAPHIGLHFADPYNSDGRHDTHMLRIHIKKGQKGYRYLGNNSAYEGGTEKEGLLKRNSVLKIGEKPTTLDHPSGHKIHVWDAHLMDNKDHD